jgi:aryl-alcohol dehydrogenase-like predicted oxidoreductase
MSEHTRTESFAHPPSTLRIGDLDVRRLGYGTIRLPGDGVWGELDDPAHARTLLRRAVELGINFLDTASFYGPLVSNRLIFEALHPYPRDLVIVTKLGTKRLPNKGWAPAARPEELRRAVETDLRTLRVERLRHLALSCVDARQIEAVLARTPIVAVQNAFGVGGVDAALARTMNAEVDAPEAVLELCTARGIAYVPFLALRGGKLSQGKRATVAAIAARHGASPSQIALAWLWARSPVILPIPGTRSLAHLEENWAARRIALSPEEIDAIAR